MKHEGSVSERRKGSRGAWRRRLGLLLCLCLVFGLCPVVRAASVEEITAQMNDLEAQISSLETELERDYPNVVSVNGKIIRSNPLTVEVIKLFGSEYYVVQNPVADSTYMFGMYYNNCHKVTGSTVIYVDGVATNATVVGTGYPRAKDLKRQINNLKIQLSDLDDQLYAAHLGEKYRPIEERNGHLKSLQSVRQDGVRLVFKVGNPYLLVCGEETKADVSADGTRFFMRGQEVYPVELAGGIKDYGVCIEEHNLKVTPVVIDGTTMVAPRPLVEWLGGSLDWDASTGVITCSLNGNSVAMITGNNIAYVNGVAETMPAAVTVYNNKTVIPLRFVAEKLGCQVEWIPGGQYIRISGGTNQVAGMKADVLPPEYSWAVPLLGRWRTNDSGFRWTIVWNAAGQYVELKNMDGFTCRFSGKLAYNEEGALCVSVEPLEKTSGIGNSLSGYWQIYIYDNDHIEACLITSYNSFPMTFERW